MSAEPLYTDPFFVSFYDLQNRWAADFDLCARLAQSASSVLDLGCGTGELAAHLAQTHRVTGVDPAPAMLDIARTRPGGDRVQWVQSDAASLDLGDQFDLITMTGHAFQILLTEADQRTTLATIRRHLAPSGRFILDMRNRAAFEVTLWNPPYTRKVIDHPAHGQVTVETTTAWDPATGIAAYTHSHTLPSGDQSRTTARIRFDDHAHMQRILRLEGLSADRWFGDWHGNAFTEQSPEIIPLGRQAEAP
ncbi:MAG: class I SAM-dependent methyltransferase [Pseudomonadota bacterium]